MSARIAAIKHDPMGSTPERMEKKLPQLFCSFRGNKSGESTLGWCVLDYRPLAYAKDVVDLISLLEKERGYDVGSIVLNSFQRLETAPDNQTENQES